MNKNSIMKITYTLAFILFATVSVWGQKSFRALGKVYTKNELEAFKEQYGNLDLLEFAYDNAISFIPNNGNKNIDEYPLVNKTEHFTDLKVQILPHTQYFRTETPGELLVVKSLYQLQLAYNGNKK